MGNSENHQIGKRAGIVSFFTFLSRIMGLVRDAVVANFFGASATADAFYVAFRIPNLLRRLTADGALTIAFVPIFTEHLKKSREDGYKVASIVFTYLSLVLVVITLAGVLFAPYLVKLIAWGFSETPEKFRLTVYLTRIMFPYIFLISLTALAMGILNSLKHFASPAAAPICLNIAIIIGASVLSRYFAEPTAGLAIGVLIGGTCQLLLQVPELIRNGMLPRLNFDYRHPALKSLILLMIPAAFGAAVYQVNVLVVTFLASFLPHGSVSYLWYADRINEFPLGIFAIAIATVTLPTLSDHAAASDMESFKSTFRFGLKGAFAITIPAAVGLFILSAPVVRLLFERGVFSAADTVGTAGALCFFVAGLPFVSAVRNIVPAFFVMRDAKTPVVIATVAVIVNAACAPFLMRPLLHRGLAFSLVIADAVNFVLLFIFLRRKIGLIGGRDILASVLRVAFASAVMGASVVAFKNYVVAPFSEKGTAGLAVYVFTSILAGLVAYLAALKLVRAPEFDFFIGVFKKRLAR